MPGRSVVWLLSYSKCWCAVRNTIYRRSSRPGQLPQFQTWETCHHIGVHTSLYSLQNIWTNTWWWIRQSSQTVSVSHSLCLSSAGCQPDEPLASLATTNRITNVYGFLCVIMLLMYSVLRCLYSVGNKITTTTTATTIARPPHEPLAILSCTPGLAGHPFHPTQLWHG